MGQAADLPGQLKIGQTVDLSVTNLSHQGEGIGRWSGQVVFVPGALPGEVVRIRIRKQKKKIAWGELLHVLAPAPERVLPPCKYHGICGGCGMQQVAYPRQLQYKQEFVQEALQRIGGFSQVEVQPTLSMDDPWRYRNKGEFQVRVKNTSSPQVEIGFYQGESHQIVDLEDCLLFPELWAEIISDIRAAINDFLKGQIINADNLNFPLQQICLRQTNIDAGQSSSGLKQTASEMALIWKIQEGEHAQLRAWIQEYSRQLMSRFPAIVSIGEETPTKKQVLYGQKRIHENLGDFVFALSPWSFFQVNGKQTPKLFQIIQEYAQLTGVETVLDLYCGAGVIGLSLKEQAQKILGIEYFAPAVKDARHNVRLNQMQQAQFFIGKAETLLPEMQEDLEEIGSENLVVLLDPPRGGCAAKLLDILGTLQPIRIVYVSCNPVTLARDLRILADKGYRVDQVQPVDLFAETTHVESVVLMSRKD